VPIPAGPDDSPGWTPSLERVAAYVPRRTLVGSVDGYGTTRRTFDTTTTPQAGDVTALIEDAVAWVLDRTGALHITLYDSGRGLAARRAAAFVELGYPDNRDDIGVAEQLLRSLEIDLAALADANTALTGDDPATPGVDDVAVLPYWSFPATPAEMAF
jgi:hypothetical protein